MKTYTDEELGSQHARLGLEAKYPENKNYMRGFAVGDRLYHLMLLDDEPLESMLPGGTNDQNEAI